MANFGLEPQPHYGYSELQRFLEVDRNSIVGKLKASFHGYIQTDILETKDIFIIAKYHLENIAHFKSEFIDFKNRLFSWVENYQEQKQVRLSLDQLNLIFNSTDEFYTNQIRCEYFFKFGVYKPINK